MRPLPTTIDCLIVGGGPAGAALAGLLARQGVLVVLVDDGRARLATPIETLLPAALQALERSGLADAVRAIAEVDRRRHGARWDRDDWTWRDDGTPGLCLRRGAFDAALRAWAVAGGAVLARPATVAALPTHGAGQAILHTAAGEHRLAARCCAVATGRRGSSTLLPLHEAVSGPATASFAFHGAAAGRGGQALVAATADGWCWWIGDGDHGGIAILTVDADELRARGRRDLIDAVLRDVGEPMLGSLGDRPATAVRATARLRRARSPVLLLGDAAATLDPLASQGTEKALIGAEAAAVALRTALTDPTLLQLAVDHHARWERDLFAAHQRAAAGFYARVERFADRPFWHRRSQLAASVDPPRVPAALVAAGDLRPRPWLQRLGGELVRVEAFAVGEGEPLARIGRVAIAPLLSAFATARPLAAGVAAAGQDPRLYSLGAGAVRAAAIELWQQGFLRAADSIQAGAPG